MKKKMRKFTCPQCHLHWYTDKKLEDMADCDNCGYVFKRVQNES